MNPPEYRYSTEHEWVKPLSDGLALVGITNYAQEQLGDIVYLYLPKEGTQLTQQKKLGEIESVKSVADVFSPISGIVKEVNKRVEGSPELMNQDPYGEGWLLKVSLSNPKELDALMSAEQYEGYVTTKD